LPPHNENTTKIIYVTPPATPNSRLKSNKKIEAVNIPLTTKYKVLLNFGKTMNFIFDQPDLKKKPRLIRSLALLFI
jgi:hypothetical protein